MEKTKSQSLTTFQISLPITFTVSARADQKKKLRRFFGYKRNGKTILMGISKKLKEKFLKSLGVSNGKELVQKDSDFADLTSDAATLALKKIKAKNKKQSISYRKFSELWAIPTIDEIIKEEEEKEANAEKV